MERRARIFAPINVSPRLNPLNHPFCSPSNQKKGKLPTNFESSIKLTKNKQKIDNLNTKTCYCTNTTTSLFMVQKHSIRQGKVSLNSSEVIPPLSSELFACV